MKTAQKPSIPRRMQAILWSKNIKDFDLKKDKVYIIHHTLAYGSLKDIQWLFKTYPKRTLSTTFRTRPLPVYTKPSLSFAAQQLLIIPTPRYAKRYLKTIF